MLWLFVTMYISHEKQYYSWVSLLRYLLFYFFADSGVLLCRCGVSIILSNSASFFLISEAISLISSSKLLVHVYHRISEVHLETATTHVLYIHIKRTYKFIYVFIYVCTVCIYVCVCMYLFMFEYVCTLLPNTPLPSSRWKNGPAHK
jgi:hypothetical protein